MVSAFFLSLIVLAAPPRPCDAARGLEPVILTGASVSSLQGRPVQTLQAFTVHGDQTQPVPLQIDAHNAAGKIALLPPSMPPSPPGNLGEADELVMAFSDAGDRLPAPLTAEPVVEVALEDPINGVTRYLYVTVGTPAQTVPQVEYKLAPPKGVDEVITRAYRLQPASDNPATYNSIRVGNGTNLINRIRLKVHARFLSVVDVKRDDGEMESQVLGMARGPLRVTRKVQTGVRMFGSVYSPAIENEAQYYAHGMVVPFHLDIPTSPGALMNDLGFTGYMDAKDLQGLQVRLNTDPRWLSADGRMGDDEKSVKLDGAKWFILRTATSSLLIFLGVYSNPQLATRFFYQDEPEAGAGWPRVGFAVDGMERLPRGTFDVVARVFVLDYEASKDDLVCMANTLQVPLRVTSRVMTRPDAGVGKP